MSHPNATLTARTRLRLARLIVEQGWTHAEAAKMFMVAAKTAAKWAQCYRAEGVAGMADRSSRPHRSPARTAGPVVRAIVRLRWRYRSCPVQIGGRLGLPAPPCTRCWCAAGSTAGPASTGSPANPDETAVTAAAVLRRAVAYACFYPTETLRRAALPGWLHFCNHHRPHSATGGKPPVTRLTNLPRHHI